MKKKIVLLLILLFVITPICFLNINNVTAATTSCYGYITETDGDPIAGAEVTLYIPIGMGLSSETVTDSNGYFHVAILHHIQEFVYGFVFAYKEGYYSETTEGILACIETPVNMELEGRHCSFDGTVYKKGTYFKLVGAKVELTFGDDSPFITYTDNYGHYEFNFIRYSMHNCLITAQKLPYYKPESKLVFPIIDGTLTVNIYLTYTRFI